MHISVFEHAYTFSHESALSFMHRATEPVPLVNTQRVN